MIKSRAPLRISFAGGGTDLEPYCVNHGGCVLSSAINIYANVAIEERNDRDSVFYSLDKGIEINYKDGRTSLPLLYWVCQWFEKEYEKKLNLNIYTFVECPEGSGLGGSSGLIISLLGALHKQYDMDVSKTQLIEFAYHIEREIMNQRGGWQDYVPAVYGGINFIEFKGSDIIVNPVMINEETLSEIESNSVLFFTGKTRSSSIIQNSVVQNPDVMERLKAQAERLKKRLFFGDCDFLGESLSDNWIQKKRLSQKISTERIDTFYDLAMKNGSTGGKVLGAGGGGHMFFYCPGISSYRVKEILSHYGCIRSFNFMEDGIQVWKTTSGE